MSWIDNILNSGAIVWALILLGLLHLYLKKTGKTFIEFVREIREFFSEINKDE